MSESQVLLFPQLSTAGLTQPTNGLSQEIEKVFEYWKQQCDHPRALLDSARERAIRKQLKAGRSFEELKLAILGASLDEFSQGRNDRHKKYDDLTLIFRDAPHIEKFIDIAVAANRLNVRQSEYRRRPEPPVEHYRLTDDEYKQMFGRARSEE